MAKVAAKAAAMPSKSARTQRNKRTRDEDEAGPAEVVNGTKGKRPRAAKKGRKKVIYDSDALDDSEAEDEPEDEYEAGSGSEPEVSRDEDEEDDEPVRKKQKRSSTASGAGGGSKLKKSARGSAPSKAKSKTPKSKSKARSGAQTRRKKASDSDEDADEGKDNESDDNDDVELKEGQEIVGKVVQAPTTGRVPPGQISQNTFDFLAKLKDPKCNDREWFRLHEPVYRLAEKEWKDFIEVFTDLLVEVDPQVPPLPPKDVIHRIYRDIRFSNDKTPYKTGLSASFSRSGRKGIFAGYFVAVKPGNESMLAAGLWCPGKNELSTIRSNILRNPHRLRTLISSSEFTEYFGEAKPGARRNIFGMEDELKVAPKGIAKDHPDIDLLKCRSFAVVYHFKDEQVLDPAFKETLAEVFKVAQPFVHCLNDMMTVAPAGDSDSDGDEDGGEDD